MIDKEIEIFLQPVCINTIHSTSCAHQHWITIYTSQIFETPIFSVIFSPMLQQWCYLKRSYDFIQQQSENIMKTYITPCCKRQIHFMLTEEEKVWIRKDFLCVLFHLSISLGWRKDHRWGDEINYKEAFSIVLLRGTEHCAMYY